MNKRAYIFPDIAASADYHPALTAELNSGPPALQIAKKKPKQKNPSGVRKHDSVDHNLQSTDI